MLHVPPPPRIDRPLATLIPLALSLLLLLILTSRSCAQLGPLDPVPASSALTCATCSGTASDTLRFNFSSRKLPHSLSGLSMYMSDRYGFYTQNMVYYSLIEHSVNGSIINFNNASGFLFSQSTTNSFNPYKFLFNSHSASKFELQFNNQLSPFRITQTLDTARTRFSIDSVGVIYYNSRVCSTATVAGGADSVSVSLSGHNITDASTYQIFATTIVYQSDASPPTALSHFILQRTDSFSIVLSSTATNAMRFRYCISRLTNM